MYLDRRPQGGIRQTLLTLLRSLRARWFSAPPADAEVGDRQSGAIPYAYVDETVVFLLITSRRTGRWIFPKGSLPRGASPQAHAAREAFEEAGVEGRVESDSIGSYRTWKTRGISRIVIEVAMYPLLVETQADDWPEKGERHRHWVTLTDARRLLTDDRLLTMVDAIARRDPPRLRADRELHAEVE